MRQLIWKIFVWSLLLILAPYHSGQAAPPIGPKRYAIVITNPNYPNFNGVLQGVALDGPAIKDLFLNKFKFDGVFDETFEYSVELTKKLEKIADLIPEDSLIFIYYSGHGVNYKGGNHLVGTGFYSTSKK